MTIDHDRLIGTIGYVVRCVLAATLSLICARALSLGHPVWASVSALVVSQERICDTRRSLGSRASGTLIGVAIGLAAGTAAEHLPDPPVIGVAIATILCATIARERPAWRTCMWTAPIVVLTVSTTEPLIKTAFHRAAEVLLGGAIGAAIHELTAFAVRAVAIPRLKGGDSEDA